MKKHRISIRDECTCKLRYNGFADWLIGSRDNADKAVLSATTLNQHIHGHEVKKQDHTSFPSARYGENGDLDSMSAIIRAGE